MPAAAPALDDADPPRHRLLMAALRLFAEQGFAKTTTREIAQAAGANVAAIRYYFGDKAGLYRACFTETVGSARDDIALYDRPELGLRESMQVFMQRFLDPMKQGELVQLCTRLHFREMLEPSALWQEEIENGIVPAQAALARVLCRHLGLAAPDTAVHGLVFAIVALPIYLYACRDVVDRVSPGYLGSSEAIDEAAARLADQAVALAEAEALRRQSRPNNNTNPTRRIA